MFPLTHVRFCQMLLGDTDSKSILGAVFPDIVITGCLSYNETHFPGWELFDYILQEHPEEAGLAKSIVTHTVFPEGLDYYGDENYNNGYKGYCFQRGALIVDKVIAACNIPEEYGLWKAHNFIEMGIELQSIECQPVLVKMLKDAFEDHKAICAISNVLSGYYSVDSKVLQNSFKGFFKFIELNDINSNSLAEKYNLQMRAKHGISIDVMKCTGIIEEARNIINNDINMFLDDCMVRVKMMLERRAAYE
ncbi:MAG: hypothetical protein ACOZCL_08260 [Bacillota bacterium]